MEALCDYYYDFAFSSPASLSDLSAPMESLELADWHQDLHDQIELMREMLLPEINREYLTVSEVWFENQVPALEEDKRFLEVALKFLSLTRDDEIKWPKNECFSFVRRIKSYVLHLRDLSYGNLPLKLNKEVSTEPPSLRKWPRLAIQHDLMYEEFQSLKEKYLTIVTHAFAMYCKFYAERGEKYSPLAWNFAFCTTFLRRPKDHLFLISRDVFDFYARRIKLLVTGVDPTESLYNNNSSVGAKDCSSKSGFAAESADAPALSNSAVQFELESADWHDELHKEIELMRKTEWPDIKKFYISVRKMCHQGSEPVAELEEDKKFLEFALKFLSVPRSAKISWSKEACFDVVDAIKLYALRYRIEYRVVKSGQLQNSEQQQQLKMEGSRDSSPQVEWADWHSEVHNKIEWMREKYLSEIEEAHRRVSILQTESVDSTIIRGDEYFLMSAVTFLKLTRNHKFLNPKDHCLAILKRIEVYALRYRKSDIARLSTKHLQALSSQLKMEVEADDVKNPSLTIETAASASSGSQHVRQSSWSADEAKSGKIPRVSSDPGCLSQHWQPQLVLGA